MYSTFDFTIYVAKPFQRSFIILPSLYSFLTQDIFNLYFQHSCYVVQYFTRGEDRDDPFWHTATGWQQDHSQDDFWLIELQFPFRCSHLSPSSAAAEDQFKFWGNCQTFGMKIRNMFTGNSFLSSIPAHPMSRFFSGHHQPPFVCSFHNNCHKRRAKLRRISRQIIDCCTR